jgi:hypothetical protein
MERSHCLGSYSTYDRASSQVIFDLAVEAEARRCGRGIESVHILAIDSIQTLLRYDEYEMEKYLGWLIRYGTRLGIWVMATTDHHFLETRHPLLNEFGSLLSSYTAKRQLENTSYDRQSQLLDTGLFSVNSGNQLLHFWVPED